VAGAPATLSHGAWGGGQQTKLQMKAIRDSRQLHIIFHQLVGADVKKLGDFQN
jgi:hypothetical protein